MHGDGASTSKHVFADRFKRRDTVSIGVDRAAIACINPMIHQYRSGPILVLNFCWNPAVPIALSGIAH